MAQTETATQETPKSDKEWTESLAALLEAHDSITEQIREDYLARERLELSIRELMEANNCTKREVGGFVARLAPQYSYEPNPNLTPETILAGLQLLPIDRTLVDKAARLEIKFFKRGMADLYAMGGNLAAEVAKLVPKVDQPPKVEIKKAKPTLRDMGSEAENGTEE